MNSFFLSPTGGAAAPITPSTGAELGIRSKVSSPLTLLDAARTAMQQSYGKYSNTKTKVLVRRYGIK